jgi:lipid II:glycine glycyltransferase (peptidoglycan interpeptide bridge formation enzyme)
MRKEIFDIFKWHFGKQVKFCSGSFDKVLNEIKNCQLAFYRRQINPTERKELKAIFKRERGK